MSDALASLIGDVLGAIFGSHVDERRARRHEQKIHRRGKTACFLRTVHGRHPNLSPIWSFEEVQLSPGAISTRRLRVPTDGLDLTTVRPAQGRELWSVPPETTVVMIRVPDGTVQWAVPDERFEWALSRVLRAADTPVSDPAAT